MVTHDQSEAMALADRIALMHQGRIEQLGTADEIYHAPATTFVAGFVGSPPMNLVAPGSEAHRQLCAAGWLPADAPLGGGDWVIGVRPESLRVVPESGGQSVGGSVIEVEPQGSETLVAVNIGDAALWIRLGPRDRPQPGERIALDVDPAGLRFFDAATGRALRRSG
jgi:ABC-type sugar transport system ATPase subunit